MRVELLPSESALARHAAGLVCVTIASTPAPTLALPSGRTPEGLYDELSRRVLQGELDLSSTTVFAVDELHGVSRVHPATNASYFRAHLAVPLRALHILDSEATDPDAECARFRVLIEDAGGLDLAVLGIGTNGHIAFNEPGSTFGSRARRVELAPSSREAYAAAFGTLEAVPRFGLTLGIADLLDARAVLLLATGADKAGAVARALESPPDEALPASALQRHPDATALLDRAAGARLAQRQKPGAP
jgi:glucosamine-6-phosphate deaminase